MNILRLLISTRGAVKKGRFLALMATGGIAAAGMLGGSYQHDTSVPLERYTFNGIVDDDGSYGGSAIDFSDDRGVVLSAGAPEGNGAKYLNDVEHLDGRIGGSAFSTGKGDGLARNGVDDTGKLQQSSSSPYGMDGNSVRASVRNHDGYSNAENGTGSGRETQRLGSASITTVSGGSSGSSNVYTPSAASNRNGKETDGKYRLSGDMSSLGQANTVDNALASARMSQSSFGNNGANIQLGNKSVNENGKGLAGIAKYSAKVAAHGNKVGANAQAGAFLDSNNAAVGGVSFGQNLGEGGSDDFASAKIDKAQKSIKNWSDDKQAYARRLAKARKNLAKKLLQFLIAAVAGATLIYFASKIHPAWIGKVLGAIILAGVSTYAGFAISWCSQFMKTWRGDAGALPVTGMIVAGGSIAACLYLWLHSNFGVSAPSNAFTSAVKGAGSAKVMSGMEEVVTEATAKDPK